VLEISRRLVSAGRGRLGRDTDAAKLLGRSFSVRRARSVDRSKRGTGELQDGEGSSPPRADSETLSRVYVVSTGAGSIVYDAGP